MTAKFNQKELKFIFDRMDIELNGWGESVYSPADCKIMRSIMEKCQKELK